MLDTLQLQDVIVSSMATNVCPGRACFALSGGVDSTLLTAIAAKTNQFDDVIAYTAVTGSGSDLPYAVRAADALGIELRRVKVPTGLDALDFYDEMSGRAGAPLSLVGNSIGFAAVCAAAKADGFDTIVDGTGAEQVTAGNHRIIVDWLALAEVAGCDNLVETFVQRNGEQFLKQARRQGMRFATMADAIEQDLTASRFTYWRDHHTVTQRAVGIKIVSPFLAPECDVLKHQPLEWYCPDGWLKSPLRKLLALHTNESIAYRKDNQGLRWPIKSNLTGCRRRMRQTIAATGVLRELSLQHWLEFKVGITSTGRLTRLYKEATAHRLKGLTLSK